MTILPSLQRIEKYFLDTPPTLKTAHTIQVLLIRQTQDYSIFRTEETRELNIVTLPRSINDNESVLRVAMLASKQKAPETRMFLTLTRTLGKELGVNLDTDQENCWLKDNLCRKCPRCILFGAVTTERGVRGAERWNIKHRVEYSTGYSIEPYEEIAELMTFTAVSSVTQSTGRALGYTENVQPLVNFPSVITLHSVTPHELIMYLKTVMACKSYGAETRIKGDVSNHIVGIVAGYEEIITSLEFALELSSIEFKEDPVEATEKILTKYAGYAAFKDRAIVFSKKEVDELLREVSNFDPTKEFIERMYEDSINFRESIQKAAREEEKREE